MAGAERESLIDDWLPSYQVRDAASRVVAGDPTAVYEAARSLDLLDDPIVRALFAIRLAPARALAWYRGVPAPPRLQLTLDSMTAGEGGFVRLEESPGREVVIGAAGRFWTLRAQFLPVRAEGFRDFREAGYARAAIGLRVRPVGEGRSRVTLEVRVQTFGRWAGWSFRAYWLLIGRFSHLIRRRGLERLGREFAA